MDLNSDQATFCASITAVLTLTLVIGVLYLPLFV
jgi:hypothetical protein